MLLERATLVASLRNETLALAESEQKYRTLVTQAEEMILVFDVDSRRILDANAYATRALGYSLDELLALRLDDLVDTPPAEISARVAAIIERGELRLAEGRYRRRDGVFLDVDIAASLAPFGGRHAILALARDITERKSLQRQLVQAQKMESLGVMAGQVAHDFNNLLTTILGFAGLLKRSTRLDIEERENLGLIEDAARQAADITSRLLSFARGGLVRFGPVDLRAVVHDTLRLAAPMLHSGLAVTVRLPESPVRVEGDGGQLQQALNNIIMNAKDAMPEGGRISLSLQAHRSSATLTIVDDGPGMTEEIRSRIFEPFVSTKPVGSGTGLGMAITYGIIQGHRGDITVASDLGRGTTFTITLPVMAEDDPLELIPADPGAGDLVLVVDDDEMVRRTTTATLAALGYNSVEAKGGAMAIELFRARPERFAAVLLDLVMPGITGGETFRALTAIRPEIPVIVCTGYAADAHIDADVKRRIAGLLQKPFASDRLERALIAVGVMPRRSR
jgi:PAS domain S-box-containing protein